MGYSSSINVPTAASQTLICQGCCKMPHIQTVGVKRKGVVINGNAITIEETSGILSSTTRHGRTATFRSNMNPITRQAYYDLSHSQALRFDIQNLVDIYKQEGVYNQSIMNKLMALIDNKQNKYPDIFNEKNNNMVNSKLFEIITILIENHKITNINQEKKFIDNLEELENMSMDVFDEWMFNNLCKVIYDDSQRPDLIQSIISLLEHNYSDNDYVTFLLNNIELLLRNAHDWFLAMIGSLLHTSDDVVHLLFLQIRLQNKKEILRPVFEKMKEENLIELEVLNEFYLIK